MRISDWSSDVCSSDLIAAIVLLTLTVAPAGTAYADPPPWAPAHGWLAKHDDGRRHRHHRDRDRHEVYVHHYYDSGPAAYRAPIIVGQGSAYGRDRSLLQIGRAHVCTPVTTAPLVCRLPLEPPTSKLLLLQ